MRQAARTFAALALVAFAAPALACGFEKSMTTTQAPTPAPSVASAPQKAKAVKTANAKSKAPARPAVATVK